MTTQGETITATIRRIPTVTLAHTTHPLRRADGADHRNRIDENHHLHHIKRLAHLVGAEGNIGKWIKEDVLSGTHTYLRSFGVSQIIPIEYSGIHFGGIRYFHATKQDGARWQGDQRKINALRQAVSIRKILLCLGYLIIKRALGSHLFSA